MAARLLVCLVLTGCCAPAVPAEGVRPAGDQEKIFFYGFERERILADWLKAYDEEGDVCHLIWPGDRGRCTQAIKKGDVTEGQWAAVIDIGTGSLPTKAKGRIGGYDREDLSSVRWDRFRPGFLANLAPPGGFTATAEKTEWTGFSSYGARLEHAAATHSYHAKFYTRYAEGGVRYTAQAFPIDWRGYRFLRMDVKPEKGQLSLRMACEDDKVSPAVERRFVVPAGNWVTLEVDLDEAVQQRQLDLGRIVNFWVFLEEITAPSMVYLDNVRLSQPGVAVDLPVIRGSSKVPRPVAPVVRAARPPIKPDRRPLTLGEPVKVSFATTQWGKPIGHVRIWAYDNQRLLLDAEYGGMRCTADGGAHWQAMPRDFQVPGGISSDPQAATAIDQQGNVLVFGNCGQCLYHCAPPVDSMYFRKLVMDGSTWIPSPLYVVGGETRGCSQGRRLTVLRDGRIWVAYRVHERQGLGTRIHAAYSDDGGMSWRGAGVEGKLTGTLTDTLVGGPSAEDSGVRALHCDPLAIVPYGDQVAVLWEQWSHFDGKKWSSPQPIKSAILPNRQRRPLRLSTVSLGKEILLSTDQGLVAWDGTAWRDDESVQGLFLTTCGDRMVGFSVAQSGDRSGIRLWKRATDGKWSSQQLAAEELPIAFNVARHGDRCLAVPSVSPASYAPVAWTCRGEKWVKVLRVPVE